MTRVDVIVPCYRYGHFLRQSVESVLAQSIRDVRVLIIDDASPDDSAEVAGRLAVEDSRVTFIHHTENKGHIRTYNEGIEWASAEYMLILSADDYLLPGALERAAELMDRHPEVAFTFEPVEPYTTKQLARMPGLQNTPGVRILTGLEFVQLSGARNIVNTPSAVVRTRLQKQLGGYRPELPHSGDMEMWLRFAAHGHVGMFESPRAVYRRHPNNMSLGYTGRRWLSDMKQRQRALEIFFETHPRRFPESAKLQRKLTFALAQTAIGLASTAFNEGHMEVSRELGEYALGLSPHSRTSVAWLRFMGKRALGQQAWHKLQPLLKSVRQVAAR